MNLKIYFLNNYIVKVNPLQKIHPVICSLLLSFWLYNHSYSFAH